METLHRLSDITDFSTGITGCTINHHSGVPYALSPDSRSPSHSQGPRAIGRQT